MPMEPWIEPTPASLQGVPVNVGDEEEEDEEEDAVALASPGRPADRPLRPRAVANADGEPGDDRSDDTVDIIAGDDSAAPAPPLVPVLIGVEVADEVSSRPPDAAAAGASPSSNAALPLATRALTERCMPCPLLGLCTAVSTAVGGADAARASANASSTGGGVCGSTGSAWPQVSTLTLADTRAPRPDAAFRQIGDGKRG